MHCFHFSKRKVMINSTIALKLMRPTKKVYVFLKMQLFVAHPVSTQQRNKEQGINFGSCSHSVPSAISLVIETLECLVEIETAIL